MRADCSARQPSVRRILLLIAIALTALLSSFSVPGIPHGWLLLVSPLLATNGIPVEGIALLFAVDVVPDIFATNTNVTADMAIYMIPADTMMSNL